MYVQLEITTTEITQYLCTLSLVITSFSMNILKI